MEEAVMEADLRVEAVDGVEAADTVAVSVAAVGGKEVAEAAGGDREAAPRVLCRCDPSAHQATVREITEVHHQ